MAAFTPPIRSTTFCAALALAVTTCVASEEEPTLEERFRSHPHANSRVATLQWATAGAAERPWMIGVLTNSTRHIDAVRVRALRALMKGNWPAESAVPILVPLIRATASRELRSEIAACLVKFGETSVPPLVEELEATRENHRALTTIVIVLKHLGKDARPALPILKRLRKRNDPDAFPLGLGYRIDQAIRKIEPEHTWRGSLEERLQMTLEEVTRFDGEMPEAMVPEPVRSRRHLEALYHALGRKYQTNLHEQLLRTSRLPKAVIAATTPYLGAILIGPSTTGTKEFENRTMGDSILKKGPVTRFNEYPEETRILAAKTLRQLGADAFPVLPCLQLVVRDSHPTIRRLAVETLATMAATNRTAYESMLPALTDRTSEIAEFAWRRLLEIDPRNPAVLRRLTVRRISSQYVVPLGGLFTVFPLLQLLAVAGLAVALGSFEQGKPARFPKKIIMLMAGMIFLSEVFRHSLRQTGGSGLPFTAFNWLFWIALAVLWTSRYFRVTDNQADLAGPSGVALQATPTLLLLWLLILFSPVLAILLGIAGESPDPLPPPGKMYVGARPLGFGTYIVVFLIFGTLLGLMALHGVQSKQNRFGKYLTLLNLTLGFAALLHHPVLLFRMLR